MSWPTNLLNGKTDSFTAQYFVQISSGETQFLQSFSGHDLRGDFGQRLADGLCNERHGARRARIHFKHINFFALHGVLHVHQADDLEFTRHRVRVFADGFDDALGKRMRRQYHRGIAGMDAGKFDVFQHPADDDGALVRIFEMADIRDAIHVHLRCVFEKFIHEHRAFRRRFNRELHVMRQLRIGINDLHRATAQHEARTHQNRIGQPLRNDERLFCIRREAVRRLRNFQFVEHRREQFAVFGDFDALRRRADDVDAVFLQAEREVQRRLPAELRDCAPAFFAFVNVQHVFQGERLEKYLSLVS